MWVSQITEMNSNATRKFNDSTPVGFIDTESSVRDALLDYRLLNPKLSGQRNVARRRLAAHTRELMCIQLIVVHTLNWRCQESGAISPPSMIQSC